VDHPVDRRYIPLQRISGWILAAVLGFFLFVGLFIILLLTRPGLPIAFLALAGWLVVTGTVAALGHVWPAVEHRHLFYRLSDRSLQIRRGVFWRERITVPRNRIQHTDVSQGPLERQFGLATLLVHTAGTEFARVSLPGLENGRALAIRDHLMALGEDHAL
jgi:membrane protein YdbS with pleckstrin-like domain